jgi:hypothetical protein
MAGAAREIPPQGSCSVAGPDGDRSDGTGATYSCPKCEMGLGNKQRECPNGECGHIDRLPRDPAKKLLGFHAYRRKWATERKHLPLKDVAEAGGWLDKRSLEQ